MKYDALKQKFRESDRIRLTECDSFHVYERIGFDYDKEIIVFSRAFRRLSDKTQIYPGEMGDHYRTRLTHTLEVAEISDRAARYFGFDSDLCAAIAYGHDLGHAPFGHSGERILHEIMIGKRPEIIGNSPFAPCFGGFNHNFQSVRLLDVLETNDTSVDGKNVSWQVLEGVLKHTKSGHSECSLESFIQKDRSDDLFFTNLPFSVTFEGQIVAIADEIAQVLQDIEDGIKNPESRLNADTLIHKIKEKAEEIKSSIESNIESDSVTKSSSCAVEHEKECLKLLTSLIGELNQKRPKTSYGTDYLQKILMRYFLSDVFIESDYLISKDYDCLMGTKIVISGKRQGCVSQPPVLILSKEYIKFSKAGNALNSELKKMIHCIINDDFVSKFDSRAEYIIKSLFGAYYENPLLLPFYVRIRIQNAVLRNQNIYKLCICDPEKPNQQNSWIPISEINMNKSSTHMVSKLIETLKIPHSVSFLNAPEGFCPEYISSLDIQKLESNSESTDPLNLFVFALFKNNKAFVRCICDYIAGMSDNYAMKEYRALFIGDV